ncbi:LysR family transcriptional regulator [Ligilactobacillus saerimneri]|uniref:LysR family transcriptional regulator n=1 Tax=Ligilactobacillus saerimneri TaxID=228229 RepID=A0A7H9ELJ4_9LACO|nr:LysR family transcriptional regulator [Ligilactobacillus saerimneri]QLL78361.1 LysR family transcriptional regulator [Ligilactobacillus saerimneri]
MNLKWLEYYDKLVEEKNFSKVATFFGVSQPTITMAIKRLEESYQTHFFERDYRHKTLRLTAFSPPYQKNPARISPSSNRISSS